MDYNAKMEEVEVFWEDSFELCKATIEACKAGKKDLNASMLKEINGFIKQSVDFLKYREAETAFTEQDGQEEEESLEGLPDFSQGGDEFKLPDDLPTFNEE